MLSKILQQRLVKSYIKLPKQLPKFLPRHSPRRLARLANSKVSGWQFFALRLKNTLFFLRALKNEFFMPWRALKKEVFASFIDGFFSWRQNFINLNKTWKLFHTRSVSRFNVVRTKKLFIISFHTSETSVHKNFSVFRNCQRIFFFQEFSFRITTRGFAVWSGLLWVVSTCAHNTWSAPSLWNESRRWDSQCSTDTESQIVPQISQLFWCFYSVCCSPCHIWWCIRPWKMKRDDRNAC